MEGSDGPGAFDGVRVIELAQWVFVPVAGALLADWGADVVRVEKPTGDPYRGLATQGIGTDSGGVNLSLAMANRGKRSVALDPRTERGREALPPEALEGIVVASASPVDPDDGSDALYRAVMTTYGDDIDLSRAAGHGAFSVLAGFAASLDGMSGEDISPSTITAAIKAMDEQELPDGAGLVFRCDGEQVPGQPAVCVRGALTTTLDAQGRPTTYTPTR